MSLLKQLCMVLVSVWFRGWILLPSIRLARARRVELSNVLPWVDRHGQRVNAHDGSLVQVNSSFYLFGTVYETCRQRGPICNGRCGYFGNRFAAYQSTDMSNGSWALLSDNVLPAMDKDNDHVSYWEANVNYNDHSHMWVMVYWSGHYGFVNNRIAVAVATDPAGPFVNVPPLQARPGTIISDTVALWKDPLTSKAYVRYNTRDVPLRHVVEELTDDWLATTGRSAVIFEKPDFPWYDGGGMFRRGPRLYVMLGSDCCFCQWGGDARVFVADSPLGPWTPQAPAGSAKRVVRHGPHKDGLQVQPPGVWHNEVNPCSGGVNPPAHVANMTINPCSQLDVQGSNFTVPAQQFGVATLSGAQGQPIWLYFGENFNSAPDGIKAHDLSTWLPLRFTADGTLLPLQWLSAFAIDV